MNAIPPNLRCWAIFWAATPALLAQMSPGPLSKAHADLDSPLQCTQCHVFGQAQPVFQCSECHTVIGARVAEGRGYHASVVDPAKRGLDCAKCHREHVGRSFQLIDWPNGMKNFDHDKTGYPLLGAHREQGCRDCHKYDLINLNVLREAKVQDPDRTFLGLSPVCGVCHEDEHRGQLSEQCDSCHTFDSWKEPTKFDHAQTEFPLTGRHRNVDCIQCHSRDAGFARYRQPEKRFCKACHEDPHQGAFQNQSCASCHNAQDWKLVRVSGDFDHSRTDFPLLGKHGEAGCRECHVGAKFSEPVVHERCLDCHDDDPHNGQFDERADGGDCAACHTEDGFIPTTFTNADHEQTEYPLIGKHAELKCGECHEPHGKDTRYRIEFAHCRDCHEDAHKGEFDQSPSKGQCEECHAVDGFHPSSFTMLRHRETRFPLQGSHRATPCISCHQPPDPAGSTAEAPFHFDSLDCAECHEHPHGEQFAAATAAVPRKCETCHQLDQWDRLKQFDHDQTKFPLKDAHRTVACAECHHRNDDLPGFQDVLFEEAPTACSGCHEDVHNGQFDQGSRAYECSVCHTNVDWRPTQFDHDKYSTFSLAGAHEDVPCKMCHERVEIINDLEVRIYRGTPTRCEQCHQSLK